MATSSLYFGTLTGSSYLGDTWVFSPASIEWTDLSGVAAGMGSTPSARRSCGMASAYGLIFIFGGSSGTKPERIIASRLGGLSEAVFPNKDPESCVAAGTSHFDDTWSFHPLTARWTSIGIPGASPPARHGCRLAAAAGEDGRLGLYLFGGFQGDSTTTSQRLQNKLRLLRGLSATEKKAAIDSVVFASTMDLCYRSRIPHQSIRFTKLDTICRFALLVIAREFQHTFKL